MMFNGRKVASVCDADLYSLWSLFHILDDSFGPTHVFQTDSNISKAWVSLLNQVDDAYSSTFLDEGFVSSSSVVTFLE